MPYTHKDLVEIAYKWAVKNTSSGFAFKELKSMADEIPDVIAFGGWESTMIEVKVSRGDFYKDMDKPHRAKGMGNWRFYCCPDGMIKPGELPPRWGLIYVNESGKARIAYDCRKKKIIEQCTSDWQWREYPSGSYERWVAAPENRFEADMAEERRIMYTALRRLFLRGYMPSIYDPSFEPIIEPIQTT